MLRIGTLVLALVAPSLALTAADAAPPVAPVAMMAVALAVPISGCNDRFERRVQMINDTRFSIVRLYGSVVGADSWQEDVLGDSTLKPGGTVRVNWDDGGCGCYYDFKAVYSDGDTTVKERVNVCQIESFRFHE